MNSGFRPQPLPNNSRQPSLPSQRTVNKRPHCPHPFCAPQVFQASSRGTVSHRRGPLSQEPRSLEKVFKLGTGGRGRQWCGRRRRGDVPGWEKGTWSLTFSLLPCLFFVGGKDAQGVAPRYTYVDQSLPFVFLVGRPKFRVTFKSRTRPLLTLNRWVSLLPFFSRLAKWDT